MSLLRSAITRIPLKRSVASRPTLSMASFSAKSSSPEPAIPSLISAHTAIELHKQGKVKFLDGSWHLNKARKPDEEFTQEHLPGSRHLDIDAASDHNTTLPHMLPSAEEFEEYVSSLGVSSDDHLVIYSTHEAASMPRVWWMFRLFGHKDVSVLDGGLPAWKRAGGKTESGTPAPATKGVFSAKLNPRMVVGWQDVLSVVETGSAQIIDARSQARFLAQAPEPRAGLPSGHIPGSLSLPFTLLVQEGDVTSFRSKAEIRDAFKQAGVVFGSRMLLSCGSGVTAAVLGFGLHLLGKELESCPIYDGSWSEWASRDDLPREPPAVPTAPNK